MTFPPPKSCLRVRGTDIVDGDGNSVILKGVSGMHAVFRRVTAFSTLILVLTSHFKRPLNVPVHHRPHEHIFATSLF
jgi:hypothetical protein